MNGFISDAKLLYKFQENMRYSCASGYKTTGGQDEEVVQCLADGWSSQPACRKEHGMCLSVISQTTRAYGAPAFIY